MTEASRLLTLLAEDYSPEEVEMMNRTSRSGRGAIGSNAKVPRVVTQVASPEDRILDFGAGKEAAQTQNLRAAGFKSVDAYDIGGNVNNGLHVNPKGGYNVVFASNVMNVQPDANRIMGVAQFCKKQLANGGTFVCNFPKENSRKSGLKDSEFVKCLQSVFQSVEKVDGCFVCR